MEDLIGLIPAAGKGTRAYPYTHRIPKGMLPINGVPNIERLVVLMRDQLGIRNIVIVVGYQGQVIRRHLGDGSRLAVRITYLQNDELDKGWAWSVLLARPYVKTRCCVMLSDECYVDSNHAELLSFDHGDAMATCAVMPVTDTQQIRKNYAVRIAAGRITELVENPDTIFNNLLGLGTFVFHRRFFDHIAAAFEKNPQGEVDCVSLMANLCRDNQTVRAFEMRGNYVNINDRDSLQLAKYFVRESGYPHFSTTLLIYSEGDEDNLQLTIDEYRRVPGIDHMVVILPHRNTIADRVRANGVRILQCPPHVRLYGEKIKYAMDRAPGDILVLTEASYSFHARDLVKLQAYLKEADMVIGTRTTRQLIRQGANMRGIVRLANIALAKLLEVLWWERECRFTDVGCTFRAVWRSSYDRISGQLKSPGPEFSVEMMIELMRARERIIEIPVSYHGLSFSMYRKYQNLDTFKRMLRRIIASRTEHRNR